MSLLQRLSDNFENGFFWRWELDMNVNLIDACCRRLEGSDAHHRLARNHKLVTSAEKCISCKVTHLARINRPVRFTCVVTHHKFVTHHAFVMYYNFVMRHHSVIDHAFHKQQRMLQKDCGSCGNNHWPSSLNWLTKNAWHGLTRLAD